MTLDSTGSIATHIAESFVLPAGVSGNLVETVDMARVDVQNFTGVSIPAGAIPEAYQSAITNFSKAQALSEAFAWASTVSTSGGAIISMSGTSTTSTLQIAELSVGEDQSQLSALNYLSSLSRDTPNQFRELAMMNLKNIGRHVQISKSLS